MKTGYKYSLLLSAVVLTSLCITACAAPGIPTAGWSFDFHFPFWSLPFSILGLALYFLPTIIAAVRRCKSILGIVLVNIFTGWTFIGWVVSLVWSLVGSTGK
jgi:hypothetical protein